MNSLRQGPKSSDTAQLQRFTREDVPSYGCAVLEWLEVPCDDAREVAECLLQAELRDVDSHGLIRLPRYAERFRAKVVKVTPAICVESVYRGHIGGWRQWVGAAKGARAMDRKPTDQANGGSFLGIMKVVYAKR